MSDDDSVFGALLSGSLNLDAGVADVLRRRFARDLLPDASDEEIEQAVEQLRVAEEQARDRPVNWDGMVAAGPDGRDVVLGPDGQPTGETVAEMCRRKLRETGADDGEVEA